MKVKSVILLSFLFFTANICINAAKIDDFGSQEIDDIKKKKINRINY